MKNSKKEYLHQYYLKNKAKIMLRSKNRYNKKKEEILVKNAKYTKRYRKFIAPWFVSFDKAKQRCNNPKQHGYKNYGGKGIKMLMTLKDFKYLWFRDKAYEMKRPSIDRKDSSKNYKLNNCRFIELSINSGRTSRTKNKLGRLL